MKSLCSGKIYEDKPIRVGRVMKRYIKITDHSHVIYRFFFFFFLSPNAFAVYISVNTTTSTTAVGAGCSCWFSAFFPKLSLM